MIEKYWFIICGTSILLHQNADGKYTVPLAVEPPIQPKPWHHIQVLPDYEGVPCRSFLVDTLDGMGEGEYATIGLRESWNHLSSPMYDLASKASELAYWHTNTKYCGVCGGTMIWSTDISKKCEYCGKEIWPQVSPAIIVRIQREFTLDDGTHEKRILLVHAKNFRRSEMYGLVAGFVETGETFEQCVHREVREEVGLRVKNLVYFGSQSWPYPSGVMVGFTADWEAGEIALQEEELSRAGWFSKNNMPQIPDKMSIARRLIDDFLNNV